MAAREASPMIGDNQPDIAEQIRARLAEEYAALGANLEDALAKAREVFKKEVTEETQGEFAQAIKDLTAVHARVEAIRVAEKEPHLTSERAIDSFFGQWKERLLRDKSKRGSRPGAADALKEKLDAFVAEKARREREERERQAREAREAEERARREREKAERERREAEAAAERARKEENKDKQRQLAAEAEERARIARAEEDRRRQEEQDARIAASASTADIVRTRTDEGRMVTGRQVPYVEITDKTKLDLAVLAPYLADDALLKALKMWARTTNHKRQMPGAIIELRDEAVVR